MSLSNLPDYRRMITSQLRAEAERLGVLTPAFERSLAFIDRCDELDAELAALERRLRGPR